jgi:hypothetical protein
MSQNHTNSLDRITAVQLLPIAATIVAAGTGAEVAEILPNPQHAYGTVMTCYVLWGMSVPLAMIVLAMYYQRLAVHKLPPREVIVSCFLPLGPLGFGGYTYVFPHSISHVSTDPYSAQDNVPRFRLTECLPKSPYTLRPHSRQHSLCDGILHRADYVGFRSPLALYRPRHNLSKPSISIQYGMVGFHIPAWCFFG